MRRFLLHSSQYVTMPSFHTAVTSIQALGLTICRYCGTKVTGQKPSATLALGLINIYLIEILQYFHRIWDYCSSPERCWKTNAWPRNQLKANFWLCAFVLFNTYVLWGFFSPFWSTLGSFLWQGKTLRQHSPFHPEYNLLT